MGPLKPQWVQERLVSGHGVKDGRPKVKRSTKPLLVAAGAVIIAIFLVACSHGGSSNKDYEEYKSRLSECDAEGAMEYAQKLDSSAVENAERLQRFLDAYDAGDWSKAVEEMNKEKRSFTGSKHTALYCDCYYQMNIPLAEQSLQDGDLVSAIESLLQFQNRFHDGAGNGASYEDGSYFCDFSDFEKFFPDEASHYFNLVCEAGDAALKSENEDAIELLSGFETKTVRYPRTYKPEEFTWAKAYSSYKQDAKETASQEKEERKARRETTYDAGDLKNWNGESLEAAYGVGDITAFTPADPQPCFYIVVAKDVIDPETHEASEGGHYAGGYTPGQKQQEKKWLPADTDDLLARGSYMKDSALTLTDDPDKASFALVLDMNYEDSVGSYTYDNGRTIPVYNSTLNAELVNLVTKETIKSETLYADPYITNIDARTYIEANALEKAQETGRLFGGVPTLDPSDFTGYWSFVGLEEIDPALDK